MSSEEKYQEMQILEQNIHSLIFQKQAFQIELAETNSAINEVEKSKEDVFRMVGKLMIKSKKEEVLKELSERKSVLESRVKSVEEQQDKIQERLETMKEDLSNPNNE